MALNVIKQASTGNLFADRYRVKNGTPGSLGSEYDIIGLYTFLCTTDSPVEDVPKQILEDLEHYRRYCEERKSIWIGRGSRESKFEQTEALRKKIVESRLSRTLSEGL